MKLMKIFKDIKYCILLTIVLFTCIVIVPCKELSEEEIDNIMRKYFEDR